MKAIRSLLTGLFLLANLLFLGALSLHVVWAPGKVAVVPKEHLTLLDTYRDVRSWTPADAMSHPAFLVRLTEAGRLDLISHIPNLPEPRALPQTSATQTPAYQSANPAIVPGLEIPAALVSHVEEKSFSTKAVPPVNPLVKRNAGGSAADGPSTRPAASSDAGSKGIFDFGR